MAEKIQIGVTGNARRWSPSWWCTKMAITLAGAKPIRISIENPSTTIAMDALIIGGGDDINPDLYMDLDDDNHASGKFRIDPQRDQLEIKWIEWAIKHQTPLLGICRGAQLINVVLGGTLHSDISHLRRKTYNRNGLLPTKQAFIEPKSKLKDIVRKPKLRVNSLHHQAVDKVGTGLKVASRDLDGFVQAFESSGQLPVLGVQWHPEYLFYLPSQFRIFRWLISTPATSVLN